MKQTAASKLWGRRKAIFAAVIYPLIRRLLFLFDPEKVHYAAMNLLKLACNIPFARNLLSAAFKAPTSGPVTAFGLSFKNPVGLAAGFDKNARWLTELEALGFGAVEIGTVTPLAQDGNEKPRLFRLPKDQALINRMGFNNEGIDMVAKRLRAWRAGEGEKTSLVVGGNIGKNKTTPNEDAWKDYEKCFNGLFPYVDYFVVNVSSPNTPGLRELQEKESLRKILSHLQVLNAARTPSKPILLKIAPDLTVEQVDDVIDLAIEIRLDGLVASNTTISRDGLLSPPAMISNIGAGGLSGRPLAKRSTEIVAHIYQKTRGGIPVIASGGIFTGADALEKKQAGAVLVQVWTGFVYQGPAICRNICKLLNNRHES